MPSKKAAIGTALGTALALFFNSLPGFIEIETLLKRRDENSQQITLVNEAAAAEPKKPLELNLEQEYTYRLIFPFKMPTNPDEESVFWTTDDLNYMNYVRTRANATWAKSVADLYSQPLNPLQWRDFLNKTKILGKTAPYVPPEDITNFQRWSSTYQGTCTVDPEGKCIVPKPLLFQMTQRGDLIPVEISNFGLLKRKKEVVVKKSQPAKSIEAIVGHPIPFQDALRPNTLIVYPDGKLKNISLGGDEGMYWMLNNNIAFIMNYSISGGEYGMDIIRFSLLNIQSNSRKSIAKSQARVRGSMRYVPVVSPDYSSFAFVDTRIPRYKKDDIVRIYNFKNGSIRDLYTSKCI